MADMEMVERVARAICGHAASGFCLDVGGNLGCKRGRGEAYNGSNCIATREQLVLTPHWDQARAAIEAMRNPPDRVLDAMNPSGRYASTVIPEAWNDAIDAILKEE